MSFQVYLFVMIVAILLGIVFYSGFRGAATRINDLDARLRIIERRAEPVDEDQA